MKKIKVMHFVAGLLSGGVEQMLYNYCRFMNHDKYEFIIVYQHEPVDTCRVKIESTGCRTCRITARNESFIGNIKDSIRVIKEEKPDIVHAHMNLMNFCALYAAKKCGVNVRISHSHIAEKNKGILFRMMASVCKQLSIHFATDLFACGQEAGEYLYGIRRMKSSEVKIIENAIDLKYFEKDDKLNFKFRKKNNLENKFIVGHIGRFSQQKNHERLVNIFYQILKKQSNAFLLLIGTGELEEQIKEKVKDMGISNNVLFYGTTNNMKEVYSSIDTFILPSLFEGFPVVSIEIQAANIPAIFSSTIAKTCRVTKAIDFVDLKLSDDWWANKTLEHYYNFEKCDLKKLYEKYDIKSNVIKLDSYYENCYKKYCQ